MASNTEQSKTEQNRERLELYVLVIFFFLVLLLPIGFLRRRRKSFFLYTYALGVYTSTHLLIPYVLGLIRSYSTGSPFWVVALVFIFGSVDKVNALDLGDRANVTLIWVKNFTSFAFALYILLQVFMHEEHSPFRLIYGLYLGCLFYSFYKIMERVNASQYAIGNDPNLTSLVLNVSKSLTNVSHSSSGSGDPLSGCKYVVNPHFEPKIFTTVDEILSCEDGAILSRKGDSSRPLKNTSLSFSLFWLLLHRFVGVPSYERSHQKEAWEFVKDGMLNQEQTSPFTTIEVELTFLYDFFYSKYFVFYLKGFWCQMMKQLVFHGLFTSVGVIYYMAVHGLCCRKSSGKDLFFPYKTVNEVVFVVLMATEVLQFICFLNSRWCKMMLICMHLKRESWKEKTVCDCCIKKAAELICPVRGKGFKPWQRKLGQYSLLESSSSRSNILWKTLSVTTRALAGIRFALPGRKESDSIKLSDDIKEAVIKSLCVRGPQLSNGVASLEGNGQLPLLEWACKGFDTDAQVILIWHVATSLCEINTEPPQTTRDYRVATSLSKYCAYLVAFAPDLLPGYAANTDHICTMVIKDAYTRIKDCKSSKKRYERLMKIAEDSGEPEAGHRDPRNVLELGAVLGKVLDTGITDANKKWEVLADFWAEMILYLAPNASNEWAHARMLADGGEFITHLWVLLFHAGIVDRDFVRKAEVSTSSETNTASI